MNKNQIKEMLARRLGNRTGLSAPIDMELDLQQETTLERNGRIIPWFLSSSIHTATTLIGEDRIPVPDRYIRETEEGGLYVFTDNAAEPWNGMEKKGFEESVMGFQDKPGKPQVYAMSGAYFRVRPIPDAHYTLKLLFVQGEKLLSEVDENGWTRFASDLLVSVVGEVIANQYIQDFELAATFTAQISRAWDRLMVDSEAQMNTNRTFIMGERR